MSVADTSVWSAYFKGVITPPPTDTLDATLGREDILVQRSTLLQVDDSAGNRTIRFSSRQVQRKFQHAADFGVTGTYNPANAARFEQALRAHVEDQATLMREGTYRGEQVTHFVHPHTGVNVIRGATGAFISGWRFNPAQLQNLLSRGTL